jgi:glycosyltransferase involved in cell wall biosynthesis
MRIAFVVHKFPPHSVGGVETYSWSLARALAELGHELHVFYPLAGISASTSRVERDGIHLWRVALPASRSNEGPIKQFWHTFRDTAIEASFRDFLATTQPDMVHVQHVQGVSAELIALAQGRPRIVTLHDYWFFCANSQLLRPDGQVCMGPRWGWNCVDCLTVRQDLRRLRTLRPLVALPLAYRNLYLRRVMGTVPLLLAPSEFLRQQYIAQGFPAKRIQQIELGLDRQRLGVSANENSPGLAKSSRTLERGPELSFGFLGALAPHKGVHVLVEAFNLLPAHASLTIYGGGAAFPEYVAQLRGAAANPKIHFAGPLPHTRIGEALARLDCLVVPSVWYENSPMVIQEAYGAGIPVVASRLGALAEKVRDGETGRLFTAGDSSDLARVLRDLIAEPQQLDIWRANIRPAPTMQQHAQEMLEAYQTVLTRHSA